MMSHKLQKKRSTGNSDDVTEQWQHAVQRYTEKSNSRDIGEPGVLGPGLR